MIHDQATLHTNDIVDDKSFSIGSIPSLPIILTASIVLFAVDATVNRFRRGSHHHQPVQQQTPEHTVTPPPPPYQPLTPFVDKTRTILADIQTIEKQLNNQKSRRSHSSSGRTVPKRRPDSISTAAAAKNDQEDQCTTHQRTKHDPSCAFSAFCDRLLLTNKIWQQEKELKTLRTAVQTKTQYQKDTAFDTFCDQLLLWNKIWKLERDVVVLGEEKGRIHRERVAAVTRAAKRMVQDVQRERMVKELVKDLIEEIDVAKAEVEDVRARHEREVAEINGEWVKDYRRVTGELAQLKLAQEARLVEQDVSNDMEESLVESLLEGQRRIQALEEKIAGYISADEVTLNGADDASFTISDLEDRTTDCELDSLSELSSTSTCVSLNVNTHQPTNAVVGKPARRRCCTNHDGPMDTKRPFHSRSWSLTSVDDSSYMLPLPAGRGGSLSTRTCNHSGRPLAVRDRTMSVLTSPTTVTRSSIKSAGIPKRAPWRF